MRRNKNNLIKFLDLVILFFEVSGKVMVGAWNTLKRFAVFMRSMFGKRPSWKNRFLFILWLSAANGLVMFVQIGYYKYQEMMEIKSPLSNGHVQAYETVVPVEIPQENMDTWVGEMVDIFFTSPTQQSEARMIMHCLLHRESKHDFDKGHGDNGKAGGSLQFHQPTWEGYRKLMIKEGYVTEIGSRYDVKEAIRTTVWALKTNRSLAWGPIKRMSENNNYASCPVPTWHK